MKHPARILQIGNYPPPMCGWAIQTKLVTDELRRRGHICEVLKINENRQSKNPAYIDVQNGLDYFVKVWRYALSGYRLNVHVNGQSPKGYLLALLAVLVGRACFKPALVTFHGGLAQRFFPRLDSTRLRLAFRLLFDLAGGIACDSEEIVCAIAAYGIPRRKIASIETFSTQYLEFEPAVLSGEIEAFLKNRSPIFFSYVSFRPEYRLDLLRQAMSDFRKLSPRAGFIWLGFPEKEMPAAREYVAQWNSDERASLLLLGNLDHDAFLSLLTRCTGYVRTPACDGVSASVLESLALKVPVIASENGRRPRGVLTYQELDTEGLVSTMAYVAEHRDSVRARLKDSSKDDNVARMADWLAGTATPAPSEEVAHVV